LLNDVIKLVKRWFYWIFIIFSIKNGLDWIFCPFSCWLFCSRVWWYWLCFWNSNHKKWL